VSLHISSITSNGIDIERTAQAGRFIGRRDLERMEIVAAELDHLGGSHRRLVKDARQMPEQATQLSRGYG